MVAKKWLARVGRNPDAAAMNVTAVAAQAPRTGTSEFETRRLKREWKTISVMIECYCHGHHHSSADLCPECQGLSDYAHQRLERCRFGTEKPTCASCPIHCYQRARREQVRVVMRYAGPRMIWRHPLLCLRHWLDSLRQAPVGTA